MGRRWSTASMGARQTDQCRAFRFWARLLFDLCLAKLSLNALGYRLSPAVALVLVWIVHVSAVVKLSESAHVIQADMPGEPTDGGMGKHRPHKQLERDTAPHCSCSSFPCPRQEDARPSPEEVGQVPAGEEVLPERRPMMPPFRLPRH